MPYYSDDIIEEVRSRNDIVDVISQYVRLSKKGSTYFGLCPFHNEKTGSFSVSPNKQMYYCFGCGAGGNVFTFLMEYENFTFGEAMEALADRAGVELPKQEYTSAQRQEADKRARLLEINKEAAKYFYMLLRGERGARALSYFRKRELSDETMQKFGLGYSDQYSDDLYRLPLPAFAFPLGFPSCIDPAGSGTICLAGCRKICLSTHRAYFLSHGGVLAGNG